MSKDQYDVVIVGGGPAGATAAILLSSKNRRVALVERETLPRSAACAGWLSSRSAGLLKELGVPTKSILNTPFNDVTFYKSDFSQSAIPKLETPPGYLIDRAAFDSALCSAAVKQGATLLQGSAVVDLSLNEQSVSAKLADGQVVAARMLIIASGRNTDLFEMAGLERERGAAPIWTVQVEAPLDKATKIKSPRVSVILGLDDGGSFGLCCVGPRHVSVGVHWFGEPDRVRALLMELCRGASEQAIIPVDLSEAVVAAEVIRSPASAALDVESHVGKHTLVIGDAGGFVSAASNEGIYPAMWSAKIASEIVDTALNSPHTQDELMAFDSAWRIDMADHLRAPHTDIRFLLPLIFTNQPMADRMAAAFFLGENI